MKNAALYVFYTSPRTCSRRLRLMRSLSPDTSFYGICTERQEDLFKFSPVLDELDDGWGFPYVSPLWHWHNLDKVVCTWFVKRGMDLAFDRLLVLDWDVLLLNPVVAWTNTVNEGHSKFIDVREISQPELNLWTKT